MVRATLQKIRQWCIWDFRIHTSLVIALESYYWIRKQSTLYVGYGYFLLTSFLCHHWLSMELHYNFFIVCTLLLRWLQNIHTAGSYLGLMILLSGPLHMNFVCKTFRSITWIVKQIEDQALYICKSNPELLAIFFSNLHAVLDYIFSSSISEDLSYEKFTDGRTNNGIKI